MRDDILLDEGGDLRLTESGDIALTESVRQAVQIRLRWFLSEWRFAPDFGAPWFEDALVKNPSDARVKQIIRAICMAVDGVDDTRDIALTIDPRTRAATIQLKIVTSEQVYAEAVSITL